MYFWVLPRQRILSATNSCHSHAQEHDCFRLLYCAVTRSIPLSFFFHLSSRTPSRPFKMWYSCYREPRCLAWALFHFFSLTELATWGIANLSHHHGRMQVQNVVVMEKWTIKKDNGLRQLRVQSPDCSHTLEWNANESHPLHPFWPLLISRWWRSRSVSAARASG